MKAMVLALAVSVSESAFGQFWRQVGAVLDVVIPLMLFAIVVIGGGAVLLNLVH